MTVLQVLFTFIALPMLAHNQPANQVFPYNLMAAFNTTEVETVIVAHGPYADGKYILMLEVGDPVRLVTTDGVKDWCVGKVEVLVKRWEYAHRLFESEGIFMAACEKLGVTRWVTLRDCSGVR